MMRLPWSLQFLMLAVSLLSSPRLCSATDQVYATRAIAGWTVHINPALLATNAAATEHALKLLTVQLEEIVRGMPAPALAELRKVPLWISPEYPATPPRAEYHPNADWLREHGRDPAMAKGVEFTNVRIFEREAERMPNFALHELAHAYHDRVLPRGFDNPQIGAAYEKAKANGKYDRVEQWHGNGKPNTVGRAYAMTNSQEYFAENTEAFFSRNDFFPFTRDELERHDPAMCALLRMLWGLELNEETIWTGEPDREEHYRCDGPKSLPEIRRLVFEDKCGEAQDLIQNRCRNAIGQHTSPCAICGWSSPAMKQRVKSKALALGAALRWTSLGLTGN